MKTTLTLISLATAAVCAPLSAWAQDSTTAFKSVSVHAFAWTQQTIDNTSKGPAGKKANFAYVELDGGLNGKWGDLYGFVDVENPFNQESESVSVRDRRYVFKVISNFNLTEVGGMPVTLHAQIYDTYDNGFNDQNRVIGVGTRIQNGGFWMKPFVGVHQESKTGVGTGSNGTMVGWVAGYNFKMFEKSFSLSNWHETELNRDQRFLQLASDGKTITAGSTGHNGAVGLTWNVDSALKLGMQYRYASNKLGSATYQDGLILSARYAF